jgi:hypothetical protein
MRGEGFVRVALALALLSPGGDASLSEENGVRETSKLAFPSPLIREEGLIRVALVLAL